MPSAEPRVFAKASVIEVETKRRSGEARRTKIWIVEVEGDLYVRSVRGPDGLWYRDLLARPNAVLHHHGHRLTVRARRVRSRDTIERVSDALNAKYRRSPSLPSMLRDNTLPTTLRLVPA